MGRGKLGPGWANVAAAAATAILLTGCLGDRPRHRIGSLPFPGLLTNFKAVDPDHLGKHQYVHIRFDNGPLGPEEDGGILYTCRAGFLDLAHLRATIDWTLYCWTHLQKAMREDRWTLNIFGPDLTWWDVQLEPPDGWAQMSPAERQAWTDEVSLRTAQRIAYLMQTWHEIVTWHGHRTAIIIPEEESAFTYEDVMSHVIGLYVAERVIRSSPDDYEQAVTEALAEELRELHVLSREDVRQAANLVHGQWWRGRLARRQASAGLESGVVEPWLIPEEPNCTDAPAEPFKLPWYGQPLGHEGRIVIDSILLQAGSVRESIGLADDLPLEEKHMPLLLDAIREQIRRDEKLRAPAYRTSAVETAEPAAGSTESHASRHRPDEHR